MNVNEVLLHTNGIHLNIVNSRLKACGVGGKKSEALGKDARKSAISFARDLPHSQNNSNRGNKSN